MLLTHVVPGFLCVSWTPSSSPPNCRPFCCGGAAAAVYCLATHHVCARRGGGGGGLMGFRMLPMKY